VSLIYVGSEMTYNVSSGTLNTTIAIPIYVGSTSVLFFWAQFVAYFIGQWRWTDRLKLLPIEDISSERVN